MKKFIILAFLGLLSPKIINAMQEESKQEITNWDKLPKELKSYILSFIPAGSYKDWVTAMMVNKQFHGLLNDQLFLNDFAKYLATHGKKKANKLLEEAAVNKNISLTSALIEAADYLKVTAISVFIHTPIKSGVPGVQETLLKAGIDINAKLPTGGTGLTEALFTNDPEKAKWFIDHGANINQKSYQGKTITEWIDEYYQDNPKSKNKWLQLIHGEKNSA